MAEFSRSKAIGGALLVAGTAVGAGVLALPVVTGMGGFFPATVVYLICWLFSACTGLLLLEVCLWMPNDANIISMASRLLGPVGKISAWILYLFLFYSLTIAYVAGGGGFVVALFGGKLPHTVGLILFSGIFGSCVYMGTRFVDRINFILMIGLALSAFAFIAMGVSDLQFDFLLRRNWIPAFLALPIIFTSFSFQGIVPSLTTYLDRNPRMVRFAILVGTSLPFFGYIIWEFLILGLVPLHGEHGLLSAELKGLTAVEPLRYVFPHSPIYVIGQFFAAFALTTSFLGVTLGLLDFLSDGLQIPKIGWKKVGLCALIYIPPIIIVTINPTIFFRALGYAGGIGCALLLGLLPIVMVWVGRYRKDYTQLTRQLPGGRILLGFLGAFVLFELFIEITRELTR
ncbi:MAG: Tyrosine-specific transport protein [Chlamydiae bacterium]|nr:Tyrosine-specific transport protein [Chlamydiota bacterium]